MKKPWEHALEQFLIKWINTEEVIGILVCGSYITGKPSQRSDIDVHIIIKDECDWRERGNQYVNGFLIEYFVNPPKQIRSYYQEDYNDRSTMSMVQFATGKIMLDNYGVVRSLIEEAQTWKGKQYKKLAASIVELKKYELWDTLDNLLDCYEEERIDFDLVYYNALLHIYRVYCSLLCIEEIPYYQLSRYFTEPMYLKKYLKDPFPDNYFSSLYIKAMETDNKDDRIKLYKELTEYVLDEAGGFNIDGWKLRSDVDLL